MSFKHLYSPVAVAPITGPWKCVVYRDIRLLKAHSSSRRFSSNCVGDAAPKCSIGCGFVLIIRLPLRETPSAQCVYLVRYIGCTFQNPIGPSLAPLVALTMVGEDCCPWPGGEPPPEDGLVVV